MEASRDELARFFEVVLPHLNELQRRVVAGAMAEVIGAVARARWPKLGHEPQHGDQGQTEVSEGIEPTAGQRALGGGDIKSEDKQPGLLEALDELVHPATRGNPMSYMRWTSKSTGKLATELVRGYKPPTTRSADPEVPRVLAPGPLQAEGGHRPSRSRRPIRLPQHRGGRP